MVFLSRPPRNVQTSGGHKAANFPLVSVSSFIIVGPVGFFVDKQCAMTATSIGKKDFFEFQYIGIYIYP